MHAKVLDFAVYESHWEWRSEEVAHPRWPQIEKAVRRLDKFHYPFLHLWPTLNDHQHQLTEDCEWFSVIGGNGEYWFGATIGDQWNRHFFNPCGGEHQVTLWSSDQGFSASDSEVCRGIDIVLGAVRYYTETGGYDPSVTWHGEGTVSSSTPDKQLTLCPYCCKPLRSARARQCSHCLTDWHDPSRIRKIGAS